MDGLRACLLVGSGGALGALARFAVGGWAERTLGARVPWGTLLVNVSGCLAIGFILTLAGERHAAREALRPLLVVGFLGAYTTFSAFGWETHGLLRDGEWLRASVNVLGSVAAGLAAVRLGVLAARHWPIG